MSSGPEYTEVEQPFIDQLIQMGWTYTTGNLDHPTTTGRESFREVLVRDDLEKALRRINLDREGRPGSTTTASRRPSTPSSASARPS